MRGNDFADLKAFAAIVEHGNFTRAAAHLRVSPSALSQTLRALEERLGVRLLNRTTRSVAVTEAGARLLSRLKPAMEELEAAVADVKDLRDTPAGTVKIQAARFGAISFLEPLFGKFHAAHPDIVLDVTVDDALTDLVAGGFDVGIRLGEWLDHDMVAVKLGGHLRQVPVASPRYLAKHGTPRHPRDLLKHRCINWRQPGSSGIYAWEFKRGGGDWFSIAVKGPLVVTDRALALSAALQDVGIAFWAEERVRPFVQSGKLVALMEDWCAPFPGFFLYYPKQKHTAPPVRAFVQFLRQTWSS
ncbi:LysR substrate-binding domain-containing protein [Corallococcus interemptor]|uniref:LysR family transcriptional regulator n=1 Tax=Corallococcus interemptor TaxID=2316720 RepID=UPI003CFEC8E3